MTTPFTRRGPAVLTTAILLAVAFAGCIGGPNLDDGGALPAFPAGVHPWPRGDEWPSGLDGPFGILELVNVKIPSFDGVQLDTWIYRPDVPDGVQVPVVIWSSPYFGNTYASGDDPAIRTNANAALSVPVNLLIEHGYAVAILSLRGTGNSGGCFTFMGPEDRKDNAAAVEWLAAQEWSNGRVGMMGLSYHGTTPIMAAVENPPSLKTIVIAGKVTDWYTFYHTPQGAVYTIGPAFGNVVAGALTAPPFSASPTDLATQFPFVAPERVCPELVPILTELHVGTVTDLRNADFWNERRLLDHLPDVTTSLFITHGFLDLWGSGHAFQENAMWEHLPQAPKRMMEGQWGHVFPNFGGVDDWNDILLEWLDFWLKGIGDEAPRLGVVDYEDSDRNWHATTAWPPADAREEVLYLADASLAPQPAETPPATFLASPVEGGSACFLSEPFPEGALVAGNPYALLMLRSDQPGGLVGLTLYEVGPDAACGPGQRVAFGVADLRFHEGNFMGRDFPTGSPTQVRVDITNFARAVDPGNRLALVVAAPAPDDRTGQPFAPTIAIDAGTDVLASHVVLPFVAGTLGGDVPTGPYPPRPFVP